MLSITSISNTISVSSVRDGEKVVAAAFVTEIMQYAPYGSVFRRRLEHEAEPREMALSLISNTFDYHKMTDGSPLRTEM